MAQLSSFSITGSLDWSATTENTSSAGYMWFDGTNFRYSTLSIGVWSTGGAVIHTVNRHGGGGIQNAAWKAGGGELFPSTGKTTCHETYDGSSWSNAPAFSLGRDNLSGAGSTSASIIIGGRTSSPSPFCYNWLDSTEEYNGSSWSNGGNLITGRSNLDSHGSQNSALTVGGTNPTGAVTCTEEYNGSSWSNGGGMSTGRCFLGTAGSQNAALAIGGLAPGAPSGGFFTTEEYNGSSWSTGGCLATNRNSFAAGGTQNAGIMSGGGSFPSLTAAKSTEEYNGISWYKGGDMINVRSSQSGAKQGTQDSFLNAGSTHSSYGNCTEEYTSHLTSCPL